ncbi:hypothetical protein MMC18_008865 [Xylographa bjoerkii]|nr:hypothetical protein [Xylographa bjoerkii]
MAGAAADSSRMGITLQDYDQVIALSQANINETLRRHFSKLGEIDPLASFKAKVPLSSISAQVLAPTVELVDKKGADGALYLIRLGEGTYSTWVPGANDEPVVVKVPTNGWELAFAVDFAFEPAKKIPDDIKRQVPLPGGYSVHQLMINFGDFTRILQIDPKRSKFPIADSSKDKAKVDPASMEAALELFSNTYLKQVKEKGDCNVLGFAIQVDQAPKDRDATFLPLASKVQIVGYRPDGKAESFRQDHPYNAFCFTEMTNAEPRRPMPSTEITYSGNWFYESIGGTMAISRRLIWDSFMVKEIKNAHVKAVELSNDFFAKIFSDQFRGKSWYIDDSKPSFSEMCGRYMGHKGWSNLAYTATYQNGIPKHLNNSDGLIHYWFCPRSTVHTLAMPEYRKGGIQIEQDVELTWEMGGEFFASKSINVYLKNSLKLTLATTVSFNAVSSNGSLHATSKTQITRKDFGKSDPQIGGLGNNLPASWTKQLIKWGEEHNESYRKAENTLADGVDTIGGVFANVADNLKYVLNNQNKFIFPGNGTFDMKDPIFSDKGDLLVGLTYRR